MLDSLSLPVKSPFDILGIDSDADDAEITDAYRARVKEVHPDQGGSVREFRRIQTAYETLQAGEWSEDSETWRETLERQQQEGTHVEYLNYEVLDDFEWELDDEELFEKARINHFDPEDGGEILAEPDEPLLEAAENCGFTWPFACRGGACANCAVAVVEGEMEMPANHVLSSSMLDRGFRLSCVSTPTTDELKVVYNVKHLPGLDELRLSPQQFTSQ